MSRNNYELHHESRLSELEARRPELTAWLHPLRISLSALASHSFRDVVPICGSSRPPNAPMLHEAIIPVDPAQLRVHVHAVLAAALGNTNRGSIDALDAAALLQHAVAQDEQQIAMFATAVGLDANALHAAAQLAAVPILISCARSVAAEPLDQWTDVYCHVCGALPALAEVLGLERTRQLRCVRCGAGWKAHVLECAFCGERDHGRLGSLVPDGAPGQIAWVETCNTCHHYIKTRAALRGAAAETVLIEDARTIDLDLVAGERGYRKPSHVGYPTRVRFTGLSTGVN